MVNAGLVNARVPYFLRATFCEFFADSGRIPYVSNGLKYTRKFWINQPRAGVPAANIE